MTSVPHLTTALTGPLQDLESHILANQTEIEHWFRTQWLSSRAPFYSSVDLRNAGFKVAPVGKVLNVEEPNPGHFYWPDLDVDVGLETIEDPEKFPLKAK